MSRPRFRFTLDNATEGTLVIKEPGGWDEAVISLERNDEYYSVTEYYGQPLTFWSPDGGYNYIKTVEASQGPNATIELLIELSDDFGDTWETVFTGVLALDTLKEIDFYKLECGVKRNDFWSKFINRKKTPVNIRSSTDMQGNAVTPMPTVSVNLTSQILNKVTIYEGTETYEDEGGAGDKFYVVPIGLPLSRDEVSTSFPYAFSPKALADIGIWNVVEAKEYGDLTVTVTGGMYFDSQISGLGTVDEIRARVWVRKNTEAAISIDFETASPSPTQSYTNTLNVSGNHTFTNLIPGDFIYVYMTWQVVTEGTDGGDLHEFTFGVTNFNVTLGQITIYPTTTAESFLIHDAGQAVLDRIIGGSQRIYSEYLGGELTNGRAYDDDGCGWRYALTKGLQLREYSLTEKPFYLSFDDWWSGANPIFNLGLGYEQDPDTPSQEIIRIEPKSYFYDSSSNSVNLSFVNNIERSYETEVIFKKIEIGYQKWESENIAGIDDPQTKHTYATIFDNIGKDITLFSKFIAASLAIESTRRQTKEKSKDWKLDNDVFIISLNTTPAGTDVYNPELDENYSSITNLQDADTRYNSRLTPGRNFLRWRPFFNGGLQFNLTSDYLFSGGEGNTDMSSDFSGTVCDGAIYPANFSEKQDIDVTGNKLFTSTVYEFEHPLTWTQYKAIRNNRTKSIGISRTNTGHEAFFILEINYKITHAKATFRLLKA